MRLNGVEHSDPLCKGFRASRIRISHLNDIIFEFFQLFEPLSRLRADFENKVPKKMFRKISEKVEQNFFPSILPRQHSGNAQLCIFRLF